MVWLIFLIASSSWALAVTKSFSSASRNLSRFSSSSYSVMASVLTGPMSSTFSRSSFASVSSLSQSSSVCGAISPSALASLNAVAYSRWSRSARLCFWCSSSEPFSASSDRASLALSPSFLQCVTSSSFWVRIWASFSRACFSPEVEASISWARFRASPSARVAASASDRAVSIRAVSMEISPFRFVTSSRSSPKRSSAGVNWAAQESRRCCRPDFSTRRSVSASCNLTSSASAVRRISSAWVISDSIPCSKAISRSASETFSAAIF